MSDFLYSTYLGDEFAYIYQDLKTAFYGKFDNGLMVKNFYKKNEKKTFYKMIQKIPK